MESPFNKTWKELLRRYARGRKVCNCGYAYATWCPGESDPGQRTCAGCSNTPEGHWFCAGGCSAAQINAQEEVAHKALTELERGIKPPIIRVKRVIRLELNENAMGAVCLVAICALLAVLLP